MIPTISVDEVHQRMQAGEGLFLLDVRQPEEHEQFRIVDGMLIPIGELMDRKSELDEYKDREIIVYCRSGNRSAHAVDYLQYLGYNAKNLRGGIIAWLTMMEKNS